VWRNDAGVGGEDSIPLLTPLVPAIGRHQASVMDEGPAEVGRGGDLLDGGINGLRSLVVGPVGPVTPPQCVEAQLAADFMPAHRRDPGARRDVIARRQLTLSQWQLERASQAGEIAVEGEAAAHDLLCLFSTVNS